MSVDFTNEEYELMEKKSKELLGWTLQEKCGISVRELIENPEKGKEALLRAKKDSGFVDGIKIGKILGYLKDPKWKELLKSKLS